MADVGRVDGVALGTPTLLHGPVDAANLAWSPNGEWIAYTQTGRIGTDHDAGTGGSGAQPPAFGTAVVIVRPSPVSG